MQTQSGHPLSWLPLLAFFAALVLLLGVAAVAFGVIPSGAGARAPAAERGAAATRRCPECGWIESRRDLPGGTDNRAITIPEYTVRMVDGSSRVFTGGPGEPWRLGDRLNYIDGELPSGK